ncbi:MAG: plasmid pRiA4b ORF-3 family protein [Acidithiobacillus ferriphilus]|uniref:plasmid pRiA4b ORF-3 family protein n=1 Tax=Acidithiobacillus ferriphilus TaxID=1689834 RepID=UPI001C068B59|nr:plasmid pRiA4b ORF-3 family protein [Acidithiobacillus ferriphilus]MBU2827447.1 plasmid pRiA4b ORF-3 family protein [Acidithiobacillus ferriphilus]MBU2846270.1 plasmid pRiA4b ORF-3 family protein [Acidithiobacillus ferriphilus]
MATSRKSKAKQAYSYLLQVELEDLTPTIWRQVWVDSGMSLHTLHHVLQATMGWAGAHLHEFSIKGKRYSLPDPEDDLGRLPVDEREVLLGQIMEPGLEFKYLYDYGDSWSHVIRVEEVKLVTEPYGAAFVDAGQGACPPEDSGGAPGYQDSLDLLRDDSESEDAQSFLQWAGEDFDPGRFDRYAANAALLRMAWNRWA